MHFCNNTLDFAYSSLVDAAAHSIWGPCLSRPQAAGSCAVLGNEVAARSSASVLLVRRYWVRALGSGRCGTGLIGAAGAERRRVRRLRRPAAACSGNARPAAGGGRRSRSAPLRSGSRRDTGLDRAIAETGGPDGPPVSPDAAPISRGPRPNPADHRAADHRAGDGRAPGSAPRRGG